MQLDFNAKTQRCKDAKVIYYLSSTMRRMLADFVAGLCGLGFVLQSTEPAAGNELAFVKLKQVPFTEVTIEDSFWAPRRETNRVASIPVNLANLEKAKNLENLRLAGRHETKGYTGPVFMDSD